MGAKWMGWHPSEKKYVIMTWEDYGKGSKDEGTNSEAQTHSSRQPCEHCDQSTLQSQPDPWPTPRSLRKSTRDANTVPPMAVLGLHTVFFY